MLRKKMAFNRLLDIMMVLSLLLGLVTTNIHAVRAETPPGVTSVRSPSYDQKLPASPHTFTWDGVVAASSYLVRIDDVTSGFMQSMQLVTATQATCNDGATGYSLSGTGNCSWSIDLSTIPGGKHLVRVQTFNSLAGPFSETIPFEVLVAPAATALLAPISTPPDIINTTSTPTFSWNRVAFATRYLMYITDEDGNSSLNRSYTADQVGCSDPSSPVCSISPFSGWPAGTYSWDIQTFNIDVPGPWSTTVVAARKFMIVTTPGIPILQAPTSGSQVMDNDVEFSWVSVPGANTYFLEVVGPSGNVISNWFSADTDLNCAAANSTCTYQATVAGVTFEGGEHTWKVKAKNSSGEGGWSIINQFNVQAAAPGLTATTLVSPISVPPNIVHTTSTPTFTWEKVALASEYLLTINGTSGNVFNEYFTASEANCGTLNCSVTLSSPLSGGQYTWDVQTWNNGVAGVFSGQAGAVRTFIISAYPGATTLVSPAKDENTTETPTFKFSKVTDSLFYLLQVIGPNGIAAINNWYDATDICLADPCEVLPADYIITLTGGAHTWRVMTWNTAGLGPWSTQSQFTVSTLPPAPTIVEPTGGAITTSKPTFVWNKVDLASSYRLTVNKSGGDNIYSLTYTTTQANCTTTCSVTPPTPLTSGDYTWTVEGLNGGAAGPPNAPAAAFTVSSTPLATTLVSPISHAVSDNTPTLTWDWVADASFYLLQIDGPSGIEVSLWLRTEDLVFDSALATLSIDLTSALVPGTHSWKVMTWNAYGSGPWSTTDYFVIPADPGAPVLIEPPAAGPSIQIVDTTPDFTWYEVTMGATVYEYQFMLQGPSGFTTFTDWVDCTAAGNVCTYTLAPALTISGTYTWKVQAANSVGGNGTWSAQKQFALVLTPDPVLLSPDATTTSGVPTFRWNVVPFATEYELTVDYVGALPVPAAPPVLPFTQTYTPAQANCDANTCYVAPFSTSNPLQLGGAGALDGSYQWDLKATNAAGNATANKLFTVGVGPGAAILSQPANAATNISSSSVFRWGSVTGALWYYLEIKDAFDNIKFQSWKTPHEVGCTTVGSVCSHNVAGLATGNYNWIVRTYNANGFTDSAIWTFKIPGLPGAAVLVAPTGTISTTQPVYIWNPVDLADWYYIRVQNASNITLFGRWLSAAEASCGTATCFVAHTALTATPLEAGAHTWNLQTWTSSTTTSNGYGPTSNASFTVASAPTKATLVSPINNIITTATPTFTWNRASSATLYLLTVEGSGGVFVNTWYSSDQSCGTSTCTAKPNVSLASGNYTWTIKTSNTSGEGPISDPGAFIASASPAAAKLVSPINGENASAQPTFTWTKVENAIWYLVEVTGGATTYQYWYNVAEANCGTQNCSVNPSTIMAAGTYSWKVQTWSSGGYNWTTAAQFIVPSQLNPTGATTLVSPIKNATTTTQPAFTWNKIDSATRYLLNVDHSSGTQINTWYTTAQANCGTITCSVSSPMVLPSGNFTWKVKIGFSGSEGAWSSTGSFIIPAPFTAPILVSPSGATSDHYPTFKWNEAPTATEYLLRVDGPNGKEIYAWYKTANICAGTSCSVKSTPNLISGNYVWKVVPWAPNTLGPESTPMSFSIQ